jgi:hypothetical protein
MSRLGGDALHTVFLIARREFITRVRSRFYLIGTVVLMGLLAGFIVLQANVLNKGSTNLTVGFVGASRRWRNRWPPHRAAASRSKHSSFSR